MLVSDVTTPLQMRAGGVCHAVKPRQEPSMAPVMLAKRGRHCRGFLTDNVGLRMDEKSRRTQIWELID